MTNVAVVMTQQYQISSDCDAGQSPNHKQTFT
jgi:hypothetical protein